MQVIVIVPDRTVVVDGLALRLDAFPATDAVQIHWHGPDLAGSVIGGTEAGPFRDPARIAPWLDAWQAEMHRRIDASHAAEAEDVAHHADWLTAEEARVAAADAARREAEAQAEAERKARFDADVAAIARAVKAELAEGGSSAGGGAGA